MKEKVMRNSLKYLLITTTLIVAAIIANHLSADRGSQHATSSTVSTLQLTEPVPGILAAVNEYRSTKHLPPLTMDRKLNSSSQAKAHDLVTNQYWSHTAPDGSTAWDFINEASYDYKTAGENLAKCYDSADAVVNAWIASPSHEAVLVADYQDAGFGLQHNDNDNCEYVVGHFGRE
ncbi:CAP domain-containing protein [Pseudarthrobacter sp. HLT3-5]|uniref:CAP domain-containing protein n=1 Tax=Pseudarthrobacter cellobiosi TaxID=2953654 RepID=UPI00208F9E99|nr:CAP domain-containing protein [Pseudarthrobacter sp. HLT3-5]MCO4274283.1 CAP domain-containing protein [Pseudarthrobacter sp. HLT3-5]